MPRRAARLAYSPKGAASASRSGQSARRQDHHHLAALEAGLGLHLGKVAEVSLDALQKVIADMLVGHFAAAEPQGDLHLVALVEEPLYGPHLHVVVVIIDARAHLDLLDFDDFLVLARFGSLLLFLILELAEVENFTHGRVGVRRHLYKIKPCGTGALECLEAAYKDRKSVV